MKNIISFFFPVADILERGITGLLLLIDGILYSFLSTLFKLFYALAEVQLLDSSVYEKIADRVYLFVGVIALFGISIGLLKALVNPDELNKGVIKSFKALITSIILLILMPTIFKYAYSFQHAVIADGVIEKIFQVDLGNNNNADSMFEMCSFDENDDTDSEMEGILGLIENLFNIITNGIINVSPNECRTNYMIMNVMEAFITPASDSVTFEIEKIGPNEKGADWGTARRYMIYTGNFKYVTNYIDNIHSPESADQSISYAFILSTIAAGILIYVVLSFCIDLGVRTVKLAFYQVIAPIPVLMRMIPGKEGQFDKWLKATISTFTEVFTRLIIISFIMFMIGNIFEIIDSMDGLDDVNLIGKAIIVIGLFIFAKQAPKLLSEALGFEGGNLSLKIKDKLTSPPIIGKGFNAGYNTANKFKGAATGALGGLHTSLVNGAGTTGFKAGLVDGWKNGGNQYRNQRQALYRGYGLKGTAGAFGGQNYFERKSDSIKKQASDAATENMRKNIENFENNNLSFKREKNRQLELLKDRHANKYNDLNNQLASKSKVYDDEENRIKGLDAQAKANFETAQNKIKQLNNILNSSGSYEGEEFTGIDANQRKNILQEIEKLKNVTYDKNTYSNMLAKNRIAKENDIEIDELNNQLAEQAAYLKANSKELLEEANSEARKVISQSDTYYGNLVSAVAKKDSEAEIKKYKDSLEGQKAIAVQTQALENLGKKDVKSNSKESKK